MPTYYLRKEPYELRIAPIEKTDGTIIPERKFMIEDRAVYKHRNLSRFYRHPYPEPGDKSLRLYTAKKLSTILALRKSMFDYSGEWFDVYDENGKVSLVDDANLNAERVAADE